MKTIQKIFLLSLCATVFSASGQNTDPIENAFEQYKKCIKKELNKKTDINITNYKNFCHGEMNQLSQVTGDSYPYTIKIIEKWVKTF